MKHFVKVYSSGWKNRIARVYDGAFKTASVRRVKPYNPYEGVDWTNAEYIVGSTHMHSREHYSVSSPQEFFNLSYDAGIRSMAWANYYPEEISLPLDTYFGMTIPSDAVGVRNSEQHRVNNTTLHYCALGSNQRRGYGFGTSTLYHQTWQSMFSEALAALEYEDGGGIILNHPNFTDTPTSDLLKMLDFDKRVLGIEVYNHKTEVIPSPGKGWALETWDEILSTGRRCFGFFATDGYSERIYPNPALGFSILLIDENTEHKALKAYRKGHFYGAMQANGTLRFTNISATLTTVSVELNEEATITFHTEDGVVQTDTNTTQASYDVNSEQVYVRIEAVNNCGHKIYSQAIMY